MGFVKLKQMTIITQGRVTLKKKYVERNEIPELHHVTVRYIRNESKDKN